MEKKCCIFNVVFMYLVWKELSKVLEEGQRRLMLPLGELRLHPLDWITINPLFNRQLFTTNDTSFCPSTAWTIFGFLHTEGIMHAPHHKAMIPCFPSFLLIFCIVKFGSIVVIYWRNAWELCKQFKSTCLRKMKGSWHSGHCNFWIKIYHIFVKLLF